MTLTARRPRRARWPGSGTSSELSRIAVLGLGFLLALTGLGLTAFRGLDAGGQVSLARARWGLLLLVIGAACWTLAAYRA